VILVIDLCFERGSLSRYEFVYPIAGAIKRSGADCQVLHFTEVQEIDFKGCNGAIFCGTALKDNAFADHIDLFSWLRDFEKPVLGICAGMQVIGAVFGGQIIFQPTIGLLELEIIKETPLLGEMKMIEGYHLHNFGATLPEGFQVVAGRAEYVEAFKHLERPIYGIIFHPEVRNRWILERFAELPEM
jgi:GMP synthase-like glutamine amidotransferase